MYNNRIPTVKSLLFGLTSDYDIFIYLYVVVVVVVSPDCCNKRSNKKVHQTSHDNCEMCSKYVCSHFCVKQKRYIYIYTTEICDICPL